MTKQRVLLMAAAYRHAMTGTGRKIRRSHGLTLQTVAEAVGVRESTLCRWEQGQRRPSGNPAANWAALLADLERTPA